MHCHCGINNRAPRLTFMNPCKPEVRPGTPEESDLNVVYIFFIKSPLDVAIGLLSV